MHTGKITLKYEWPDGFVGLPPKDLASSLVGFEQILEEFCDVAELKGNRQVLVTSARDGSIVVEIALRLTELGFTHWYQVQNFLAVAKNLHLQAAATEAIRLHRDINDFVAQNPVDAAIGAWVVNKLRITALQSMRPTTTDTDGSRIPPTYAAKLRSMITRRRFARALQPLTENKASRIRVSAESEAAPLEISITPSEAPQYLPIRNEILPHLLNSSRHRLTGTLVGLDKSNREVIKIRLHDTPRRYSLLQAFPEPGHDTVYYAPLFGKGVIIEAEIRRPSQFVKPKLQLLSLEEAQQEVS